MGYSCFYLNKIGAELNVLWTNLYISLYWPDTSHVSCAWHACFVHTTILLAPPFHFCTPTLHNGKEGTVGTCQEVETKQLKGTEAAGTLRLVNIRWRVALISVSHGCEKWPFAAGISGLACTRYNTLQHHLFRSWGHSETKHIWCEKWCRYTVPYVK